MIDFVIRSTPKAGNSSEENEDAAAFSESGNLVRLAVADGATEATFARQWAMCLVEGWISSPTSRVDRDWLQGARERWQESLPPMESLPWYAQEKLSEGSYAAFAGLRLRAGRSHDVWSAEFVGDCELVILRPGWQRPLRLVPFVSPESFGNQPDLLGTRADLDQGAVRRFAGRVTRPYELWLVTDAFAHHCLLLDRLDRSPWVDWARRLDDAASFEAGVDEARAERLMRNDDTTVLRVSRP